MRLAHSGPRSRAKPNTINHLPTDLEILRSSHRDLCDEDIANHSHGQFSTCRRNWRFGSPQPDRLQGLDAPAVNRSSAAMPLSE